MQKFRKRAVARATIPAAAAASFVNPTKLRNVKKDGKRSSEKVLEKTKNYFFPHQKGEYTLLFYVQHRDTPQQLHLL